jgi:hypothetical protein
MTDNTNTEETRSYIDFFKRHDPLKGDHLTNKPLIYLVLVVLQVVNYSIFLMVHFVRLLK